MDGLYADICLKSASAFRIVNADAVLKIIEQIYQGVWL
jgi:hypothetical protein